MPLLLLLLRLWYETPIQSIVLTKSVLRYDRVLIVSSNSTDWAFDCWPFSACHIYLGHQASEVRNFVTWLGF